MGKLAIGSSSVNFTPNNQVNGSAGNSVSFAEFRTRNTPSGVDAPDFIRLIIGKFMVIALFAILLCVSAFCLPVMVIIGNGSQKQMIGIYAKRVIASMTDNQAGRNFSISQEPRDSMCGCLSALIIEMSIVSATCAGYPIPAFVLSAYVNLFPEAIFQWQRIPLIVPKLLFSNHGSSLKGAALKQKRFLTTENRAEGSARHLLKQKTAIRFLCGGNIIPCLM
jgi:hypothetical protein